MSSDGSAPLVPHALPPPEGPLRSETSGTPGRGAGVETAPALASALLEQLLRAVGPEALRRDRDQFRAMLRTVVDLALDRADRRVDRLDLKIASAALDEIHDAAVTFAGFRTRPKVTIFGSARTAVTDPLYEQTREFARAIAAQGWMVVTGAGPGIMAAGLEGAGRDNALGAAIRLPFEDEASTLVDPDRLVDMKYFFTRKLALVRESHAFVVMPGGFGTLDEAFELLTLLQTGKATPVPIVLLGLGQGYWHAWSRFVDVVIEQGYVSPSDRGLYLATNDVDEAVREITGFYRNYQSMRWVGDRLVVRLHRAPTPEQLGALGDEFADALVDGTIEVVDPLPAEVADADQLDLERVALRLNRRRPGRLRALVDALNRCADTERPLVPAPAAKTDRVPAHGR